MRFRRPAPRRAIVVTARNLDLAGAEKMAADGVAVISVPENRWAARRHQIGVAAAQRAGEAGGARAGRPRSLVRRSRRPRHRRLVVERLDRDPRRQGGHPPGRSRASSRASPGPSCSRRSRRRGSSSKSAPSRSTRPTPRARPSSPRRARSCCRWSRSTAGRSAMARPGLIASALRRDFHRYAEII